MNGYSTPLFCYKYINGLTGAMTRVTKKQSTNPAYFWFLIVLGVWILNSNVANILLRPTLQTTDSATNGSVRALASIHTRISNIDEGVKSNASNTVLSDLRKKETRTMYRHIPQRKPGVQRDIVLSGDYIYYQNDISWDSSPIVIESHKLIFFTVPKVGCTVWKQLFRRMMGHDDWTSQDQETFQPHNPGENGLKYLYNYSLAEASEMMTSPDWTRAMMVRNPKQRFLSAFLDKAVANFNQHIIAKCCKDKSCVTGAQTVEGFLRLCSVCHDDHWRPQDERVDFKYWPYIDHVGHVESAAQDARRLLEKIGAWEEFGASGWGKEKNLSIFGTKAASGAGMTHSTHAEWKVWQWYTPASEKLVEDFYRGDYENPLFQFTPGDCLTCVA